MVAIASHKERLIGVAEVAQLLRMSESTARRLIDHGRIPSERHGSARVRLVERADAEAFAEKFRGQVFERAEQIAVARGLPPKAARVRLREMAGDRR